MLVPTNILSVQGKKSWNWIPQKSVRWEQVCWWGGRGRALARHQTLKSFQSVLCGIRFSRQKKTPEHWAHLVCKAQAVALTCLRSCFKSNSCAEMENLEFPFSAVKKSTTAFHVLFKYFFSLKNTDLIASLILTIFTSVTAWKRLKLLFLGLELHPEVHAHQHSLTFLFSKESWAPPATHYSASFLSLHSFLFLFLKFAQWFSILPLLTQDLDTLLWLWPDYVFTKSTVNRDPLRITITIKRERMQDLSVPLQAHFQSYRSSFIVTLHLAKQKYAGFTAKLTCF